MNREYVLEFNTLFLLDELRRHTLDSVIFTIMRARFDDYTKYVWDERYTMTLFRDNALQILVKLTNGRELKSPSPEYRCDSFSAALLVAFEIEKLPTQDGITNEVMTTEMTEEEKLPEKEYIETAAALLDDPVVTTNTVRIDQMPKGTTFTPTAEKEYIEAAVESPPEPSSSSGAEKT